MPSQCAASLWPWVSELSGWVSFLGSFVSLFPQILETYRDKTVDGLSPLFLLAWLCGDITSLAGALLTKQLLFQVFLALYFLLNDAFVCGQYYYYGILHHNTLATVGHEPQPVLRHVASHLTADTDVAAAASTITAEDIESIIENGPGQGPEDNEGIEGNIHIGSRNGSLGDIERVQSRGTSGSNRSRRDLLLAAVALANGVTGAQAAAFTHNDNSANHPSDIGTVLSWMGALFYVGARIPQLIKNYRRKSTDGLSPFLFATTLLCNVTYCLSIFTSCRFLEAPDKWAFFENALPFIVGSAGTVSFDLVYFYQYYVLYASDTKIREIEREIYNEVEESAETETTPLIQE